jgi:hypothetical protein
MAETAGSLKYVIGQILDTWSRGPSVIPLVSDLSGEMPNGDTIDAFPQMVAPTIATSESASVESSSISVSQLIKNRDAFVNFGLTETQRLQLLAGQYPEQMIRRIVGTMKEYIDRDIVSYALTSLAYDTSATYHGNLAADAVTPGDIADLIGRAKSQDGVSGEGWAWIGNPMFTASVHSNSAYVPNPSGPTNNLGLPMLGVLNGVPYYEHNAVPGNQLSMRQSAATTAVSVSTNVATATVAAGHGFVPGQIIYTTGLTTNVPVGTPVAITSVTATTIVYPLTAGDGALADGVGTIYSASSMALLVRQDRLAYAQDRTSPSPMLVKRETNAGYTMQLFLKYGRVGLAGGVWVLHAPD